MWRGRKTAIICLLALLLVVGLALFGYRKGVRVMGSAQSLQRNLENLEARGSGDLLASLEEEELDEIWGALAQMGQDLRDIKAELSLVLALSPNLSWLPAVGEDVAAAPDLLEMGIGISRAGDLIFEGAEPLTSLLDGSADTPSGQSTGQRLSAALADGHPHFVAAWAELDGVRQRRDQIDDERLSPQVRRLLDRLDRYLPVFETGLQGLLVAPSLLGAEEPRTYLLLAQNDNELRATGGFISSIALLRISNGSILELDFRDSYAVDNLSQPHPSPPQPLQKHMLAQMWLIRDANWSPDFPTAARVAMDIYEIDQGVKVDGVIAADLVALQSLVSALGPVRVDEYDVEVDGTNLTDLMQEYWASPEGQGQTGDWWAHRKDFMGEVLAAMLVRTETDIGSQSLVALAEALRRGLEEKHILVHVADPTVSEILSANGWDGSIPPVSGDFLMVVDTNMGFNKVNPNVDTSVDYHVAISDDGTLKGEAAVSHRNNCTPDGVECVQEARYDPTYREMAEGCYWDYLRLYVPEGARLLYGPELTVPKGSLLARSSDLGGTPLPIDVGPIEAGKNMFGAFFVVPPGETQEEVFLYELPSGVLERQGSISTYRLLVQKQPGTLAIPLRVTVNLPPGSEVLSARPAASSVGDGKVEFQTDLRVDRQFEISFRH